MASHLTNATGTMEVLEAARRRGGLHVVMASSSSVYGANPELPKHEGMATMPVSPYAAGKLAAEAATLAYGRSFGLPVLAFRFFNVFGPSNPPVTPTPPSSLPSSTPRCVANRSLCTATACRHATSPTSVPWRPCSLTPSCVA